MDKEKIIKDNQKVDKQVLDNLDRVIEKLEKAGVSVVGGGYNIASPFTKGPARLKKDDCPSIRFHQR